MFGNILSDNEIIRLRETRALTLEPFDVSRLKVAHYKLTPDSVWSPFTRPNGQWDKRHQGTFSKSDPEFVFKPNAYHLIAVKETVLLPDGVVANFVPVSEFAFRGFSLVAGMLDHWYGRIDGKEQKLFFGVKNLLDEDNVFKLSFGLAHMSLVSLAGASLLRNELSQAERDRRKRLAERDPRRWERADSDGAFHHEFQDEDD